MSGPGFPWNANTDLHEETVASEKQTHHRASEPAISSPAVTDVLPHKSPSFSIPGLHHHHHHQHNAKANGSTRKRGDSLKTTLAARQAAHEQYLRTPLKDPIKRPTARTIPPWVQDADEDDVLEAGLDMPQGPHSALVAQHNHSPSTVQRPLLGGQPQLHQRGHLTSSGRVRSTPTSRWISFARASAYPREDFNGEKDPEWFDQNLTDYSKPWLADHDDEDDEDGSDKYRAFQAKRRAWYKRIHFAIMRNPFVPLFFRLFVIAFAGAAMGLGARIFHLNHLLRNCISTAPAHRSAACVQQVGTGAVTYNQDPSALMAIIVDAVAIVYSIYITYDEYFSKPLGLRPPAAKVRLVLLDLFFIVFQSANLSLAFNSITIDQGPCRAGNNDDDNRRFDPICDCAESLSAVLLVSLVAWLLTFSISVLRLVERINAR